MRTFILKLLTFLAIPLTVNFVFVLFTPLNFFTFRSWEALTPHLLAFGGPFYPNQRVEMIEVGDLGKSTEFAIPKPVTFITDAYGYRNTINGSDRYDIVIVGDSMTAGSSLTQEDTLAAVLSRELNTPVYAFAPADIAQFTRDSRFAITPPKTVVFQIVERNLSAHVCPSQLQDRPAETTVTQNSSPNQPSILYDRFLRNMTYLVSFVQSNRVTRQPIHNGQGMLFFEPSLGTVPVTNAESVITAIKRCNAWLNDLGVQLIVLPVPDKENIYFDEIPAESRPAITPAERSVFLQAVTQGLKQEDIPVVDLLSAYTQARAVGITPYQLDDTHWNREGVTIAADLITMLIAS